MTQTITCRRRQCCVSSMAVMVAHWRCAHALQRGLLRAFWRSSPVRRVVSDSAYSLIMPLAKENSYVFLRARPGS